MCNVYISSNYNRLRTLAARTRPSPATTHESSYQRRISYFTAYLISFNCLTHWASGRVLRGRSTIGSKVSARCLRKVKVLSKSSQENDRATERASKHTTDLDVLDLYISCRASESSESIDVVLEALSKRQDV
jgi:hypothetical protein